MAEAAVELAKNVYRIPTMPLDLVNSFALVDDDGSVTLVDTGIKRAVPRIVAGLGAIGKTPKDVRRIILTHTHPDHAGSAAELTRQTGHGPTVHADDAPYLRSGLIPPGDPTVRLGRLMRRGSDRQVWEPCEPEHEMTDGELLDVAGGLRVVHTPGHSPGHVALLHEPTGVLITGDSIFNVLGLRWSVAAFCTDVALSQRTADRLADLDYQVAAFTHGPQIADRARERVRSFLTTAKRR